MELGRRLGPVRCSMAIAVWMWVVLPSACRGALPTRVIDLANAHDHHIDVDLGGGLTLRVTPRSISLCVWRARALHRAHVLVFSSLTPPCSFLFLLARSLARTLAVSLLQGEAQTRHLRRRPI